MVRLLTRSGLCLLIAACVSPVLAADPKNANWPQFRGPNRSNLSSDTGLLKEWPDDGPPLSWKATSLGIGYSSISLADGKLFTMGDKSGSAYVHALNSTDGKLLWSAKVGKSGGGAGGSSSTPTIDGPLVYALGQHGDLVCLDADTGKEVWQHNLADKFKGSRGGWDYCESVLVDGDQLLCTPGGSEATMLSLDKKTGKVLWKCPIRDEQAGYASIVISEAGGIRHYVQLLANSLVGVRATDGKLLWRYGDQGERFGRNTANCPTPIVLGNRIFATAGYGRGGALVEISGSGGELKAKEQYFRHELKNKHGGVVIVDNNIYADHDDSGTPFCADLKSGDVKWRKKERTKGDSSAAITYADERLYVRYANAFVALVEANPNGYKEHGCFKIPNGNSNSWNHPVVVGGRLYLREKDALWCYDVKQH